MAKTSEIEKINSVEDKIGRELLGVKASDNFQKDIELIDRAISNLSNGHNKFAGEDIIEFLTKVEFNKDKLLNSTGKSTKKRTSREDIEKILTKENLQELIGFEKDRFSRYEDYNLIYSYIPELSECVKVFRDSILSPDDLTKDSLTIEYDDVDIEDTKRNAEVSKNIKSIMEKYEVNDMAKTIIRKALTLGDFFVAVLTYDDEFNKMLLKEEVGGLSLEESKEDERFILESVDVEQDADFEFLLIEAQKDLGDTKASEPDFYKNMQDTIAETINKSVNYSDSSSALIKKELKKGRKGKDGEEKFGIGGSIVRMLNPESMIKLEIDGVNFGYLHIERSEELVSSNTTSSYKISDFFNSRTDIETERHKKREQAIANIFIKNISKKIDNEMVRSSPEFKDYIHVLLREKYLTEKAVNITYLNNDEVVDFLVEKEGIYGQSILSRSLFFAKLYLATLVTEIMQKISRGRDKRIVYMETGLDNDVEGVVQGVVRDIKSKEIQADSLKSITTILNNIGIFEDYYIPLFDGEKLLDFDTLQGMDVDADNPFLEFLLKSAIAGTGVPVNYIDASREVDFARNLSMQNATFVRSIVVHQHMFSKAFTKLIRLLYRNEFMYEGDDKKDKGTKKKDKNENEIDVDDITVKLPPPISLNITNVNDQINNASQTLDFITNIYIDENNPDYATRLKFRKKAVRKLLPHIDWNEYDALFESALVEEVEDKIKGSGGTDDALGGDDVGDDMGGDF